MLYLSSEWPETADEADTSERYKVAFIVPKNGGPCNFCENNDRFSLTKTRPKMMEPASCFLFRLRNNFDRNPPTS